MCPRQRATALARGQPGAQLLASVTEAHLPCHRTNRRPAKRGLAARGTSEHHGSDKQKVLQRPASLEHRPVHKRSCAGLLMHGEWAMLQRFLARLPAARSAPLFATSPESCFYRRFRRSRDLTEAVASLSGGLALGPVWTAAEEWKRPQRRGSNGSSVFQPLPC